MANIVDNAVLDKELNPEQAAAAKKIDGPMLILAGAGSGKTRCITYKIAHLVSQYNVESDRILAVTFTNKAAREMKSRIQKLLDCNMNFAWMGTFHSVCLKLLKLCLSKDSVVAAMGGKWYDGNFSIYDDDDQKRILKEILKEDLGDNFEASEVKKLHGAISRYKNTILYKGNVAQLQTPDIALEMAAFADEEKRAKYYAEYQKRLKESNAMDFDDLLVYTFVLLKNNEDILQKYIERFQYVLVDEYQDTNYAQQSIVVLLTKTHGRVCVVGDDAQSIYSFRGANIDNILDFQKEYGGAKLSKLEQNYRSTQLIVQAANSLIRHNERQIPKDVFSENEHGERVKLKPAYSDKEEAIIVCNDIRRIRRQEQCHYSDFAILYRTNSQSRSFEEQMRKDGIPYRIYGGLSFYQRKEIKDVIAYFRVVANHDDEEALRRIINYPTRGIGNTTVDKIVEVANLHGVSLWTVISQPQLTGLNVSKATLTKLAAFQSLIAGWEQRLATEDAYELGHAIIMESGISKDIYSSNIPDDLSRQENLEEFLGGMQDFVAGRQEEDEAEHIYLPDFLQEVALLTDLDSDSGDADDKVSLMTIHAAKGLEFPTVFVVGLEENIFPSPMCTNSMRELEEERRLLYVAITRAEKHCILTCAQNRWRYGRMEYDTPSRFIRDIDPSLLQVDGGKDEVARTTVKPEYTRRPVQNPRPVATQFVADPKPRLVPIRHEAPRPQSAIGNIGLQEGNVIEHQRFGIGTVIKVEGSGENTKATVEFKNAGTKQLLLKFAKYTIVK